MCELPQQHAEMGLAFLAVGDVDGRTGQAHRIARFILQRLDVQIVPACTRTFVERDLAAALLATL